MSREHVAPDWMRQLFPGLSEVDYERAFQHAGSPLEKHRRSGAPFDQTVKRFCEGCNTGWMAALERELKPILRPLIQDTPGSLDAVSQHQIAVWATKDGPHFGSDKPRASLSRLAGPLPLALPAPNATAGRSRLASALHREGAVADFIPSPRNGDRPPRSGDAAARKPHQRLSCSAGVGAARSLRIPGRRPRRSRGERRFQRPAPVDLADVWLGCVVASADTHDKCFRASG